MRDDIVMTEYLKNFLAFDLGHMNLKKYPKRIADLVYAGDLKLDLYYPEQKREKYPLVLSVFGGGWVSGFKTDRFVELLLTPLKLGYAVAVPDYTLALDAPYPQAVMDLKNALAFLNQHAQEYKLDLVKNIVWGESAGGNLSLLTGLIPDEHFGLHSGVTVRGIIAMYPRTDSATIEEQCNALKIPYAGKDDVFNIFAPDAKVSYEASPVNWLKEDMPAIALVHGTGDDLLPYLQSVEFYTEGKRKYPNSALSLYVVDGFHHADVRFYTETFVKLLFDNLEFSMNNTSVH